MHSLKLGLAVTSAVLLLSCLALAQPPDLTLEGKANPDLAIQPPLDQPPPPPKELDKGPALESPPQRDPTEPGGTLKKILDMGKASQPGKAGPSRMPAVALKGRVITKDRPPLAVLEVDKQAYIVGVGNNVAVPGTNVFLRIVEINRSDVRIEVAPLNESITLR
jgi:hypothetical protein